MIYVILLTSTVHLPRWLLCKASHAGTKECTLRKPLQPLSSRCSCCRCLVLHSTGSQAQLQCPVVSRLPKLLFTEHCTSIFGSTLHTASRYLWQSILPACVRDSRQSRINGNVCREDDSVAITLNQHGQRAPTKAEGWLQT